MAKRSYHKPDKSWHAAFLLHFAATLNVVESAEKAGVQRQLVYAHKKFYKDFAQAFKEARQAAIEKLEGEVYRRATEQSDHLARFLLIAHKPKRYRERSEIKHEFSKLSDEDLIAQAKSLFAGNAGAGDKTTE